MSRIYDTARWKRLRARHLAMFPLCQPCAAAGRTTAGRHVDHKHAISDGGDPFPAHDGLESMCPPCHSAKTARGAEHGAVRSTKPRKGCDANGNPIDAAHPWHPGGKDRKLRIGTLPTADQPSDSISSWERR